MRILITNDDGINAPGLASLYKIETDLAGPDGEVWTVAPAFEQSGVAHCISYVHPTMIAELGPKKFAAEGTPADCVLAGLYDVLQDSPPDLVLSGINRRADGSHLLQCRGWASSVYGWCLRINIAGNYSWNLGVLCSLPTLQKMLNRSGFSKASSKLKGEWKKRRLGGGHNTVVLWECSLYSLRCRSRHQCLITKPATATSTLLRLRLHSVAARAERR